METKSWYILAILHGGLAGLFARMYSYNNDPWAYVLFITFLMCAVCCSIVWWGNRSINKIEKKYAK